MQFVSYLRDQAIHFRLLAEEQEDGVDRLEFIDLALVCEEVADAIEDQSPSG